MIDLLQAENVAVEKDAVGLQLALRELFEEAYLTEAIAGVMSEAGEAERERAQDDMPVRSLSPGYYSQASYLLDLGTSLEAGVGYDAASLTRSDVCGLQALKRARGEFERDHPSCGRCGTRQDNRWASQCRSCQVKFAGKGE
jgi:hypothetical protein